MALVTSAQVKEALGLAPANTTKDALIGQVLPMVDAAIRRHTNDRWEVNVPADPATSRDFIFEESGVHTVNAFVHGTITTVSLVPPVGAVVDLTAPAYSYGPTQWEYDAAWWIETAPAQRGSGEMGFLRNWDVYLTEHPQLDQAWKVRVTAKWGYPSIPDDVKQAAIWTAVAFMENPKPYASESIAQYTRSRADRDADPIPTRAARLLEPHVKT